MYHLGVGASPGFGDGGDEIYPSVRLIDFDYDSLIFFITNVFFNFLFTSFFFGPPKGRSYEFSAVSQSVS